MFDYAQRTHRAVLDEFVPEWRNALDCGTFVILWMQATSQSERTAFRWQGYAWDVRLAELAVAA